MDYIKKKKDSIPFSIGWSFKRRINYACFEITIIIDHDRDSNGRIKRIFFNDFPIFWSDSYVNRATIWHSWVGFENAINSDNDITRSNNDR